MARSTTTQISCDFCRTPIDSARAALFGVKVSYIDDEDGGPVANLDVCTSCCKTMLSKVDGKLVKDRRIRS